MSIDADRCRSAADRRVGLFAFFHAFPPKGRSPASSLDDTPGLPYSYEAIATAHCPELVEPSTLVL